MAVLPDGVSFSICAQTNARNLPDSGRSLTESLRGCWGCGSFASVDVGAQVTRMQDHPYFRIDGIPNLGLALGKRQHPIR